MSAPRPGTKAKDGALAPASCPHADALAGRLERELADGTVTGASLRAAASLPLLGECEAALTDAPLSGRRGPREARSDRITQAFWQGGHYCARGALELALAAFRSGAEGPVLALADPRERRFTEDLLLNLRMAQTAGLDADVAEACLGWVVRTLTAHHAYCAMAHGLVSKAQDGDGGAFPDPIRHLQALIVENLDLGWACASEAWFPGMPTPAHRDRLWDILEETDITKLVPGYRDPRAALGLWAKNHVGYRLDLAIAALGVAAEFIHGLVEAGELNPKFSLYAVAVIPNGTGGTKLDRRAITRDRSLPADDPDNHAHWPHTHVPRYLTKVDYALKVALDSVILPLMAAWHAYTEARNQAFLELASRRVLHAARIHGDDLTDKRILILRRWVRDRLFGPPALPSFDSSTLDRYLGGEPDAPALPDGPDARACLWLDELAGVMLHGVQLGAYRSGFLPEQIARTASLRKGKRMEVLRRILEGAERPS
jgi:hypothetical protein